MSSRVGMKTYSRQKVCQSNIQFDKLLNDKSNKPSAAKSTGTLHRWGMTSFTSMRNASQLNGRKDKTDGSGVPTANRLLSKRRRVAPPPSATPSETSDDPFSFEAEADATVAAAAAARSSPHSLASSGLASSSGRYMSGETVSRSNKFFKSGARSSAFRSARAQPCESELLMEAVELPVHCYDASDLINLSMQPVELVKPQSQHLAHHHHHQQQPPPIVHDAFSMLLSSTGVTGDYDMYSALGTIKQPTTSSSSTNLGLFSNYATAVSQQSNIGGNAYGGTSYGSASSIYTGPTGIVSGHTYGIDASSLYGTVTTTGSHQQMAFDADAAELLYTSDGGRIRLKEEQQLFLVDHGLALEVTPSVSSAKASLPAESLYAEQLAHGLVSPVKVSGSDTYSSGAYSARLNLGLPPKGEEAMFDGSHHHKSAEDLVYGDRLGLTAKPSGGHGFNERLGFVQKSTDQSTGERMGLGGKVSIDDATSYNDRIAGLGLSHKAEESAFSQRLALDMSQKSAGHIVYGERMASTMDLSAKALENPGSYGDHLAMELASKTSLHANYYPQESTLDLASPTKSMGGERPAVASSSSHESAYGDRLSLGLATSGGRANMESEESVFSKPYGMADLSQDDVSDKELRRQLPNYCATRATTDPVVSYKAELIAAYERGSVQTQLLLDGGAANVPSLMDAGRPRASNYQRSSNVDRQQMEDGDAPGIGQYHSPGCKEESPDDSQYQSPHQNKYQPSDSGQYQSPDTGHYQLHVDAKPAQSPEARHPKMHTTGHYPESVSEHYQSSGSNQNRPMDDGEQMTEEADSFRTTGDASYQSDHYRLAAAPPEQPDLDHSEVMDDDRYHPQDASCNQPSDSAHPDVVQRDAEGATNLRLAAEGGRQQLPDPEQASAEGMEYSGDSSGDDENSSDSVQQSNESASSLPPDKDDNCVDSSDETGPMAPAQPPSGSVMVSPKKSYIMNRMKSSHASSLLRQRRIFNSPKKIDRKSLYKHRPWQVEEEAADDKELATTSSQPTLADEFDDVDDEVSTQRPTLTRVTTWPTRLGDEAVTSVRCPKKFRELYAVVKNVKQAHQCHESGETQEFNDDIEYLLDGVQNTNSVGTRCLSILSLASKCMAPSFRMHLRAHGSLTKVFSALQDAPKEANLSLCTATVMFILSQDRLNMDLDRTSLELMLQLLETESSLSMTTISTTNGHNREYDKNKEKVRELCQEQQKKGYAKLLDLDNITPGVLAMETLLSLTSRRAGEWFKEELRELGGLDHLVTTVGECGQCLPVVVVHLREFALDKLRKLDRCLRVLENVTVMNSQNQAYLITCQNSSLIHYCSRALQLCESCLKVYPNPDINDRESPSWILFNCLLSVLKVLLNLTNDNPRGSATLGEQDGLLLASLSCILYVPSHCEAEQRFDILVLSLGLLINLVEHCDVNRLKVLQMDLPLTSQSSRRWPDSISAPKALVNLFMEHEEAARLEETKTDNLLDGKGEDDGDANKSQKERDEAAAGTSSATTGLGDDIEETLQKALQKAGKNMENSMIAAYIALLLGCLIQDNRDNATRIRDHLPQKNFGVMVQMLKKYLNFMNLTNLVGSKGMKSIQRVIDILENT